MLGIFALAGMIATPIIAGKMIKRDITNHTVDSLVKPCTQYNPISNTIKNKKNYWKRIFKHLQKMPNDYK